ncbi:hypothetical protein J4221_01990 [Candidatus Pacearchaeota archaeon]|nr:hypothetical protein [Candidatus Pacearchaeota archaeon]
MRCPNGCKDGACIQSNITSNVSDVTCTDSDGGKNYEVRGYTCVGNDCKNDSCVVLDGNIFPPFNLIEYHCQSNSDRGSVNYNCPNGCKDGVCISNASSGGGGGGGGSSQSCQELVDFVKNPEDYIDRGIRYILLWNDTQRNSWWINNEQKELTSYYAQWKTLDDNIYVKVEDDNIYVKVEANVFDEPSVDTVSEIKRENQDVVCKQKEIWSRDDKLNNIYICNWDILYGRQSLGNDYKSLNIFWAKDNVIVRIDVSSNRFLSEEELGKIREKFVLEFLQDLQDNRYEFIDWSNFEIPWKAENLISKVISQCPSRIIEEDEKCEPFWQCKTEPLICPPHGYQTKICSDVSCEREDVETRQLCSPGICSGCFVPRYIGARATDNTCIPYGIRLEFLDGEEGRIYETEMNNEGDGYFNVIITPRETLVIEVIKDLPPNEEVSITVNGIAYYIKEGERFEGEEGVSYDIVWRVRELEEKFYIQLKDIHYSNAIEERYIDILFNERFNGYCDPFSGDIKQQKTKDSQGNWAECQNNYECESNVCSSGECIEIADAIRKAKGFKTLLIRAVCLVGNLFNKDKYNQCITEYLGYE